MPIYTYACQSCGSTLEKRQSFTDDPLTTHDSCGGSLRRVIHPAGIVFKGSGFYNTDYKNSTSSTNGNAEPTKADGASTDASSTAAASTNGSGSSSESSSSAASTPGTSASPAATPAPTTP